MDKCDLQAELSAIEASIGWPQLGDGGYLHVGESDVLAIKVVGAGAGIAVLLVGW